jgi:hypothetical protein
MEADELPADMEAVVARLSDPHHDLGFDYEGQLVDRKDLRDLLKAYQEQRRALERIAITTLRDDGGALHRLGQVAAAARAALNQKGDER